MRTLMNPILLAAVVVAGGLDLRGARGGGFGGADAEAMGMRGAVADLMIEGKWVGTPAAFRIIALSQVADGCAGRASGNGGAGRRCVARVWELAKGVAPRGYDPGRPDDDGLYASHLNLILGAQDRVGGPHDGELHGRLSGALAARAGREVSGHVPSYRKSGMRWPADQSATLASLRRFDDAHGGAHGGAEGKLLTPGLAAAWQQFLEAHSAGGLPWSEVTGQQKRGRLPRGCALSFGIRYTAEFDGALARRWWGLYKERYLVDRGLVGFREWPPGVDLPADADSGPIVAGVGAAATGFGLLAARAVGDEELAGRLEATARAMSAAAGLDRALISTARSTLAQAILFAGATAATWPAGPGTPTPTRR